MHRPIAIVRPTYSEYTRRWVMNNGRVDLDASSDEEEEEQQSLEARISQLFPIGAPIFPCPSEAPTVILAQSMEEEEEDEEEEVRSTRTIPDSVVVVSTEALTIDTAALAEAVYHEENWREHRQIDLDARRLEASTERERLYVAMGELQLAEEARIREVEEWRRGQAPPEPMSWEEYLLTDIPLNPPYVQTSPWPPASAPSPPPADFNTEVLSVMTPPPSPPVRFTIPPCSPPPDY